MKNLIFKKKKKLESQVNIAQVKVLLLLEIVWHIYGMKFLWSHMIEK